MSDEFDLVVEHPFDDALSQRYLVYALSTITTSNSMDSRGGSSSALMILSQPD